MKNLSVRFVVVLWSVLILAAAAPAITSQQPAPAPGATAMSAGSEVQPPLGKDSVKLLVIGDSGTGDRAQTEVGAQMWKSHAQFPYEFAIMLGSH